jgi:hypothetical protein
MRKRKVFRPRPGERRRRRRAAHQDKILQRLMDKGDAIGALCHLVRVSGGTMTLYGRPVDATQLRAAATVSVVERVLGADDAERELAVTSFLDAGGR